jgi:hypothetical protein
MRAKRTLESVFFSPQKPAKHARKLHDLISNLRSGGADDEDHDSLLAISKGPTSNQTNNPLTGVDANGWSGHICQAQTSGTATHGKEDMRRQERQRPKAKLQGRLRVAGPGEADMSELMKRPELSLSVFPPGSTSSPLRDDEGVYAHEIVRPGMSTIIIPLYGDLNDLNPSDEPQMTPKSTGVDRQKSAYDNFAKGPPSATSTPQRASSVSQGHASSVGKVSPNKFPGGVTNRRKSLFTRKSVKKKSLLNNQTARNAEIKATKKQAAQVPQGSSKDRLAAACKRVKGCLGTKKRNALAFRLPEGLVVLASAGAPAYFFFFKRLCCNILQ